VEAEKARPPNPPSAWLNVQDEHDRILGLLTELCSSYARIGEVGPGPSEPDHALASKLGALWGLLVVHFSGEEGEHGLYSDIRGALPHRAHRIALLQKEHCEILEEVRSLVSDVPHLAEAAERPRLLGRAKALFYRIRAHETKENELIHESVRSEPMGGGD